jgi:hypothetical protein
MTTLLIPSPLARLLHSQQEEIAKYKWIESDKTSRDIGWQHAAEEWLADISSAGCALNSMPSTASSAPLEFEIFIARMEGPRTPQKQARPSLQHPRTNSSEHWDA